MQKTIVYLRLKWNGISVLDVTNNGRMWDQGYIQYMFTYYLLRHWKTENLPNIIFSFEAKKRINIFVKPALKYSTDSALSPLKIKYSGLQYAKKIWLGIEKWIFCVVKWWQMVLFYFNFALIISLARMVPRCCSVYVPGAPCIDHSSTFHCNLASGLSTGLVGRFAVLL